MSRIFELSSINLASLSQRIARLDHYYQARFRNRFAPTVKALSRYIPSGGHILDIGANHGKFSKHFAKLYGGSCTVWSFEPLPYNQSLLRQIVGGYKNVRIFDVALSDKAGTADFYVPLRPSKRISPGAGHLGDEAHKDHFGTATAHDVGRISVATDTLDNVAKRENLQRLDFIKIDVQGAERLVFTGGRETLARFKPAVYCEITPGLPLALGETAEGSVAALTDLGYRVFAFPEDAREPTLITGFTPDVRDYLFLHPQGPMPG